jgi:hypothetical protein
VSDHRARRAPHATYALDEPTDAGAMANDPPPFMGRWANLYALVLVVLLAIILALLWLTLSFG